MIQMRMNLIQNRMNQMQHLQEEEGLLSSKGGQEETKEDVHRKENQRISTSCLSMLTQELIKMNQM
jgi:hypothetical protein